tara:strand:+ start:269 stop:550 length:282 start_codon:yes stop_codon:yes gene_type:complete
MYLQEILLRLSKGENVTFEERLHLTKCADSDPTISMWLKRAKRLQKDNITQDPIETLLNDLDLGVCDPDDYFKNEDDDIGEWFTGAPSWITRS